MLACVSALWGDPPNRVGRLNFLSGTVSFHPESVDEWAPATLNYPLTIGDHLWTDQDGQAEVHVGSTAIRACLEHRDFLPEPERPDNPDSSLDGILEPATSSPGSR